MTRGGGQSGAGRLRRPAPPNSPIPNRDALTKTFFKNL